MAAAPPAPLLSARPEPAATHQSAATTKAAPQARRLQRRREGGRNCRFNIPGSHCAEPNLQLIASRHADSTSTYPGRQIVAGSSELLGLGRWYANASKTAEERAGALLLGRPSCSAMAGAPQLWPKCLSWAHPGARPGAHRSRPKPKPQPPLVERLYYGAGLRRCQPCPASPPLPIPAQPIPIQSIPIQPSQNPSQNHPLRLPSNHHSRHSRLLSCRRQPPPRAARGWAWIAKACWRPSAAP
jgi:hypothetical protein